MTAIPSSDSAYERRAAVDHNISILSIDGRGKGRRTGTKLFNAYCLDGMFYKSG